MPNLLPCCENRHRVTENDGEGSEIVSNYLADGILLPFANVPGGRGVQTACWCPHSHICTEPSCPPVKYSGISGWELMRFMLSILCFRTCRWHRKKIFNSSRGENQLKIPIKLNEMENKLKFHLPLRRAKDNRWKIMRTTKATKRFHRNIKRDNET